MKILLKIITLLLFPTFVFAQNTTDKLMTWEVKFIQEYLPNLYSNLNTASIGGHVALQYSVDKDFFSTLNLNNHFIPTSYNANFDFSLLRSISLSLSYDPILSINYDILLSAGMGYTQGKIDNSEGKYPNVFSQLNFNYIINGKKTLFLNISSIYDITNKILTPSLKIGYKADFIVLSFDLLQYRNWDNLALRQNNAFSVPHITNQSH